MLRRWWWLGSAGGISLVGAWLAAALGHPLPRGLNQGLALMVLALAAVATARLALRLRRGHYEGIGPSEARWLLLIVGLGLSTAFLGLEHELGGRYFGDEGTFLANAQRMNEGRLLRPWFIYPHLLYTLNAIALWVAGLFPGPTAWLARGIWGVEGELETAALVTRWVSAGFVALTPPIVFQLGRRIAGVPAGLAGAAIAALSTVYLAVGHQSISDVPAACLATLCLALCAELLDRPERQRLWVAAGLAAGLAAGSKYPAGLVAIAIFTLWLRQTWQNRRPSWSLLAAAGAAIATFIAATPSLVAYRRELISPDGPDLLFGARLYAEAGWAGVVRGSNLQYYGERLAESFGWPLLLIGLVGTGFLSPTIRRRLLWLSVFPVAYFALLLALRVALPRNLMPILPFVAALLGCGLVALANHLRERGASQKLVVTAALLVAAPLLVASSTQTVRFARPTTRDVAAKWMEDHLPKGSLIVKEHYTPVVRYPLFFRQPRFVVKLWPDELRAPQHDFVLVASEAYNRYLNPHNLHQEEFVHFARRYRELFAELELVAEWRPSRWRSGPTLKLFAVDPDPVEYADGGTISSAEARVADDAMRRDDGSVVWHNPRAWAVYKAHLAAGIYELRLLSDAPPAEATLEIATREGQSISTVRVLGGRSAPVRIPEDAKVFATLTAPDGTRVEGVVWVPSSHRPSRESSSLSGHRAPGV